MRRRLTALLVSSGGFAILLALSWGALVFGVIVAAGVLSPREAVLCLVDSTGLCQAVVTLCGQSHPMGVKTYSPFLLLLGLTLLVSGLGARAIDACLAPRAGK
jgi:hypothetical protein